MPTTSRNLPQNLQRVRGILNNTDPALAGTPGYVQLAGQVSEILQQTMQSIEMYQEQRSSQSHTMTSLQRSSLNREQHGQAKDQLTPRPPRRFRPANHEGRWLFTAATPPRQEEWPLDSGDLMHHLNQASGQRRNSDVHNRIGTPDTRYANLRN